MVILILLIAILSYCLGALNTPALISSLLLGKDVRAVTGGSSYRHMFHAYRWTGVLYVLAADILRSLAAVLLGGLLLKGVGFPSVGKLAALFFALLGQALPLTDGMRPREGLVFPALLLLWIDWRLFLICLAAMALVYVLTHWVSMGVLGAAVVFPVFALIFGAWLKALLALLASLALLYIYQSSITRFFRKQASRKSR